MHQKHLRALHHILFEWWRSAGRVLPWREKCVEVEAQPLDPEKLEKNQLTLRDEAFQQYFADQLRRDPYRVVVAEIMLQQTQVDRVINKYQVWMKTWPRVQDLARAELSEILTSWQGLGYNRRARFLWLLAREIIEYHDGVWPTTEEELLKLPGIGKYTARAVMSFAFGQEVAVVDTNVKRVFRRLLEGTETNALPVKSEREWFIWADQLLPPGQVDPWNQLVMDFGALICTAKAPKCEACPAKHFCQAQSKANQAGFATYRELLLFEKQSPSLLQPLAAGISKPQLRFKDTDRFFRGRIIDQLRASSRTEDELRQIMSEEFGLSDELRFSKLITDLIAEKLMSRHGDRLTLG